MASCSYFAQVPVNTLMDHHDGPLQQQNDRLAALFKILASEEDRSGVLFGKALRAHAPSSQAPPDPLLASFHALLSTRTQAHASYLHTLQENVRRPWQGLCQQELPGHHLQSKKEWNRIVTAYHQRRQELDLAKRMLSQAVQEEAAALARAFGNTSTRDDEGRDRSVSSFGSAGDVAKNEAKQRARCEQLAATREEAERRASLAKNNLLNAIVTRDCFVAQAGAVYLDLAKRERGATAAALLLVAAAEKAHCQARIRAAEALEEAARTAGQEEGVEEEVGAWAARHKQPELTHRYHAALNVLDREWERQQQEEGEEGEGKSGGEESQETRGMVAFLENLFGPVATCDDDEEEERANAMHGRRNGGAAASSSSSRPSSPSSSFTALIDSPSGRAYFLRQLNARRGGGTSSTCLKPRVYDELGVCLNLFLDKCQAQNDVRAAQQALLMANTFFRLSASARGSASSRVTTADSTAAASTVFGVFTRSSSTRPSYNQPAQHQGQDEGRRREYLLACIRGHPWWQSQQVWKQALKLNVEHELRQCPQQRPWESLSSEALRGQVLRVHNLIFGQLGSLAFHMLECGVPREEVRAFIREMCEKTQMGDEQVQALMETAVGGRADGRREQINERCK